MRKDKSEERINETDLYLRSERSVYFVMMGFLMGVLRSMACQWSLTLPERIILDLVLIVVCVLVFKGLSQRRIEIHENEVTCYRGFGRKKQYHMSEISRVEKVGPNSWKVIAYGHGNQKLFVMTNVMSEFPLAIHYFYSKGIEIGEYLRKDHELQETEDYIEFYNEHVEQINRVIENGGRMDQCDTSEERFHQIVTTHKLFQESRKEKAEILLSHWGLETKELKKCRIENRWKINKKQLIFVYEDEEAYQKEKAYYDGNKNHITQEIMPTNDGSFFVKQDGMFFEVRNQ